MKLNSNKTNTLLKAALILGILTVPALASTSGGTAMPWEGPLQTVADSLRGPVAISIGVVAMFVAGGMLIFGSEIGDFAKRLIFAVLAASVMILGSSVISLLFPSASLL